MVLDALARQKKEQNGSPIRREKVKLLMFADDIILYIRNHKYSTKIY
jgi:hypothetical protein